VVRQFLHPRLHSWPRRHYDEAILQIEGLRKRLWRPEKKLLSHIWGRWPQQFQAQGILGSRDGWRGGHHARDCGSARGPPGRPRPALRVPEGTLDGCLAHQRPTACSTTCWTSPRASLRQSRADAGVQYFTPAVRGGAGCRPVAAGPADRMRAAARAKVDQFGSCRASAAHPPSIMRG